MNKPIEILKQILTEEHLLSLSVWLGDEIHSASLFYAPYLESDPTLIVASPHDTIHTQAALKNPKVSGTIAKATKEVLDIRGVQFKGLWQEATSLEKRAYFKQFPYATLLAPPIWSIHLTEAKLTHNRHLGFGNKAILTFN